MPKATKTKSVKLRNKKTGKTLRLRKKDTGWIPKMKEYRRIAEVTPKKKTLKKKKKTV